MTVFEKMKQVFFQHIVPFPNFSVFFIREELNDMKESGRCQWPVNAPVLLVESMIRCSRNLKSDEMTPRDENPKSISPSSGQLIIIFNPEGS